MLISYSTIFASGKNSIESEKNSICIHTEQSSNDVSYNAVSKYCFGIDLNIYAEPRETAYSGLYH